MKVSSAAKVGFTAIILIAVLVVVYKGEDWDLDLPFLPKSNIGVYTIFAKFDSVKGLKPGAEVQLNGFEVGEVGEMNTIPFGRVRVELMISDDEIIHEHAEALITRDSIFGGYLVFISEPRSGYATGIDDDGRLVVLIESGQVNPGGLVIMDDTPIGIIESVTPDEDDWIDEVIIELGSDVIVPADVAYLPVRPVMGLITGLAVSERIGEGAEVPGDREAGPEDLVANADEALGQMSDQTTAIMQQLGGLLDNIEELLAPEDIRNLVEGITSEITTIADNIIELTDRVNYIVATSEPYIIRTAENIEGLTEEAHELMVGFGEYNDPQIRKDIGDLLTNLAVASDRLVEILEDVEVYTSDEELRADITGSIHEARIAIEQAQGTLEAAEDTMEDLSDLGVDLLGGIETSAEFRLRNAPEPDRWSGDLNVRIGVERSDVFVTAGIEDIGESDMANVQIGWWVNEGIAARAGVHRDKLGLGIDWESDAYSIMNDIYDLNDLRWDIYAGYAILPELNLVVGVEDLLDDDELNIGFAFQF